MDLAVAIAIVIFIVAAIAPVLCILYISMRFGQSKIGLWFLYHGTHSNAKLGCLYMPEEPRERMRKMLFGEPKASRLGSVGLRAPIRSSDAAATKPLRLSSIDG